MTISIWTLIVQETATTLLDAALELATIAGLDVSSWRDGDPTKTSFQFLADMLAEKEDVDTEIIKSGFLSEAEGDWKTVHADEVYGVDRDEAVYATSTVGLTNGGGWYYEFGVGDVVVKSSTSQKTYHSTSALALAAGASGDIEVTADEAGSGSSAGVDEIDTMVTGFLGVTIDDSTAAVGVDAQSDASLQTDCETTLGALSSNGPPDAYVHVALDEDLTGTTVPTRAASTENAVDLTVTVYIAGASGAVAGGVVTAVQAAIETWSTPLCVTPTAASATNESIALTATVSGDDVPGTADADVTSALGVLLAASAISIGGVSPVKVTLAALYSLIHTTLVAGGASNLSVTITVPSADPTLTAGPVPVPGAVSVTEV